MDYKGNFRNLLTDSFSITLSNFNSKLINLKRDKYTKMEETANDTAKRTKEAIDKIIESKLRGEKPTIVDTGEKKKDATYIRYKSSSALSNDDDKSRIIKIVDKQVDPMLPPSFKIKKVPQGPSDAPEPVLHEQAKKLSAEDQKKWYIPPVVSNWKNTNGFAISIDKRMASISNDSEEKYVNDNFSNLSEALEVADKQAREEIKLRAKMQKKLLQQKAIEKENRLREIAKAARQKRLGRGRKSRWDDEDDDEDEKEDDDKVNKTNASKESVFNKNEGDLNPERRRNIEKFEKSAAERREILRNERRKKAEKELRMASVGSVTKAKILSSERDITERVALRVSDRTSKEKSETQYDSRLFLQAAGANTLNGEDQVYDKPLFNTHDAMNDLYSHGSANRGYDEDDFAESQIGKFTSENRYESLKPNKEKPVSKQSQGPIQFEKETTIQEPEEYNQDYGLNENQKKKQKLS